MSNESSNTTQKQLGGVTGKGFTKGDPRINRKGRPKSFDKLRDLARQLSHEVIKEGETMTVAEAILRNMAKENPVKFLEIAYGKVPDEVNQHGEVVIKIKRESK